MYKVTVTNSNVETVIHYPSSNQNAPHLLSMDLQLSENQANAFSFVIYKNHIGYGLLKDLVTKIKVIDTTKDKLKFEGRVLISNEIMDDSGKFYKSVTCESELAYFNDSRVGKWALYPSALPSDSPTYAEANCTIATTLQKIITNHNNNVQADKQFIIGNVDIEGGVSFTTNYETSLETLISKIISDNGVVIKIRKENGIRYLDILADIPPLSNTTITLRKNLKSFKKTPDYSTFCTRILAIGADGLTFESINNGKNYVEDLEAVSNFGIITKPFEWTDITTVEELLQKAQKKLTDILNNSYVSVEVSALDLNCLGLTPEEFEVGANYLIENNIQNFSEVLKLISLDIDLSASWNSKLVFANKPIVATSNTKNVQQQVSSNRNESISSNEKMNQKVEAYRKEAVYVHPVTHPPSIIAQDSNNRFVSDVDKANWNSKVTQANINNSINNSIDAVQIGGRNLLLNSKNITVGGLSFADGSHKEYQNVSIGQTLMDISAGSKITISFDVQMAKGNSLQIYNNTIACKKTFSGVTINGIGTVKTRVSVTVTIQDRLDTQVTQTNNYLEFYSIYGTSDWFMITNIKIERGTKNTDYTPALEDSVPLATKLETARTINGVAFDGGTNITIPTPTPTPTVYPIPLLSDWVNYGNGYGSPTYYKTIESIVHLGGLIKGGTAGDWTAIGTLPPGFRPNVNRVFTTTAATTATGRLLCYIDVQSTGVIIMSCPGANTYLSLEGISFPTF